MIEADHTFNDMAGGTPDTSGWHKVVRWVTQAGAYGDNTPAPITTAPGFGQLYTKTATDAGGVAGEHLFYHQGTGGIAKNEAALSLFPVRAAIAFDNTGTAIAGSTPFNVTGNKATPVSTGIFTIEFDLDAPSAFYIPVITLMPNGSNQLYANVFNDNTYGNGVDATRIKIRITNFTPTVSNGFTACFVTILGG